ncbi:MAG: cardiolipin synthase, partial [Spirochaetaceae bacterium]|nr:cardiolipin synthase [Spirochaetaceae bacterium]
MLVEVPRHRKPAFATAWLMILMLFPWPGFILYLFIGIQRPPRHRLFQKDKLIQALSDLKNQFADSNVMPGATLSLKSQNAADVVTRSGGMPATGNNSVEFINKSEDFILKLIADINSAVHHVHLQFYIFENDTVGQRVSDALIRAANRGVNCRLLLDAMGSRKFLNRKSAFLRKQGVRVVAAYPMISLRHYLGRMDWRTHRKIAVIDGKSAYTGSQNIVDPGYGHSDSSLVWQDLVARISGPAVYSLQAVFLSDWYLGTDESLDNPKFFPQAVREGNSPIQVLPSGPVYSPSNYHMVVIDALYHAKKQIIITTPYFIPDDAMLQAMESACRRGIDLNLVIPKKSDQFLPGNAAKSYFEDIMKWGARIHLYSKGLLHAKSISIDKQICFFGSSNFDIRSFALNFEMDLVFYGEKEIADIRKQQMIYISESEELDPEIWNNRGLMKKTVENLT